MRVLWMLGGLVVIPISAAVLQHIEFRPHDPGRYLERNALMVDAQGSHQPLRSSVDQERSPESAPSAPSPVQVSSNRSSPRVTDPLEVADSIDVDDEIAQFEENRIKLEKSEFILENELRQHLVDEAYAQGVRTELAALGDQLPFLTESRVLCTRSVCEVQWTSDEPVEILIPHLTPWLLAQTDFAIADGTRATLGGPDFSKGVRIVIRRV